MFATWLFAHQHIHPPPCNPLSISGFPTPRSSNAERLSMSWRHHYKSYRIAAPESLAAKWHTFSFLIETQILWRAKRLKIPSVTNCHGWFVLLTVMFLCALFIYLSIYTFIYRKRKCEFYFIVAQRRHMATKFWFSIALCNDSFPGGTKPLPDSP